MLVRYVTNAGINDLASLTVVLILKIGGLYLFLRWWTRRPILYGLHRPHHGH